MAIGQHLRLYIGLFIIFELLEPKICFTGSPGSLKLISLIIICSTNALVVTEIIKSFNDVGVYNFYMNSKRIQMT